MSGIRDADLVRRIDAAVDVLGWFAVDAEACALRAVALGEQFGPVLRGYADEARPIAQRVREANRAVLTETEHDDVEKGDPR